MREWLLSARKEKGWTQLEVANKLGISESYFSFVENGTRQKRMDISLASKLSVIFDIPVEKIIEMEEQKEVKE